MAYCEVADVRAMIKDDALNALIGDIYIEDVEEREAAFVPLIAAAISDAGAEIDGYLARRHSLPLPMVPRVIEKYAKDIAVYNLYSRIGIDESDREKNVLNRYREAIKFLTMLAEGKVEIGVSDTKQAANTGFSMVSGPRRFSRESLRGM
ncbi:DUF1320 domain-containing protein [Oscillospiraceae bacterium OttesenSCG-928-F05]|nr:DUF1320 domain-containing protein [Oscillospiraceae bacterium OttesenSCG-928-F05]